LEPRPELDRGQLEAAREQAPARQPVASKARALAHRVELAAAQRPGALQVVVRPLLALAARPRRDEADQQVGGSAILILLGLVDVLVIEAKQPELLLQQRARVATLEAHQQVAPLSSGLGRDRIELAGQPLLQPGRAAGRAPGALSRPGPLSPGPPA